MNLMNVMTDRREHNSVVLRNLQDYEKSCDTRGSGSPYSHVYVPTKVHLDS